jgi:hypothetical protein
MQRRSIGAMSGFAWVATPDSAAYDPGLGWCRHRQRRRGRRWQGVARSSGGHQPFDRLWSFRGSAGRRLSHLGNARRWHLCREHRGAAANLAKKPAHLSFVEAAALPLAGLTAYRALCVRGQLRPGQTVLIPGIGSGVSTMALLFAQHLGARVIVTSGSPDKLAAAPSEALALACPIAMPTGKSRSPNTSVGPTSMSWSMALGPMRGQRA